MPRDATGGVPFLSPVNTGDGVFNLDLTLGSAVVGFLGMAGHTTILEDAHVVDNVTESQLLAEKDWHLKLALPHQMGKAFVVLAALGGVSSLSSRCRHCIRAAMRNYLAALFGEVLNTLGLPHDPENVHPDEVRFLEAILTDGGHRELTNWSGYADWLNENGVPRGANMAACLTPEQVYFMPYDYRGGMDIDYYSQRLFPNLVEPGRWRHPRGYMRRPGFQKGMHYLQKILTRPVFWL